VKFEGLIRRVTYFGWLTITRSQPAACFLVQVTARLRRDVARVAILLYDLWIIPENLLFECFRSPMFAAISIYNGTVIRDQIVFSQGQLDALVCFYIFLGCITQLHLTPANDVTGPGEVKLVNLVAWICDFSIKELSSRSGFFIIVVVLRSDIVVVIIARGKSRTFLMSSGELLQSSS
jgi:hypothetical protein